MRRGHAPSKEAVSTKEAPSKEAVSYDLEVSNRVRINYIYKCIIDIYMYVYV
jgi:hypothetical protein